MYLTQVSIPDSRAIYEQALKINCWKTGKGCFPGMRFFRYVYVRVLNTRQWVYVFWALSTYTYVKKRHHWKTAFTQIVSHDKGGCFTFPSLYVVTHMVAQVYYVCLQRMRESWENVKHPLICHGVPCNGLSHLICAHPLSRNPRLASGVAI